jgi:hypothetical protein
LPSAPTLQKSCNTPPRPRLKRSFLEPAVDTPLTKGSGDTAKTPYFSAICRTFISGGTRIRTGDTMIFSPRRYVSSRPTLYQYVAKVSRDLASEAKSFPAAYHPILTRLQYGCSTLVPSPCAYRFGFAYRDRQNDTPMCDHDPGQESHLTLQDAACRFDSPDYALHRDGRRRRARISQ